MRKEALLYEKLDNQALHCFLCAHHCRIEEGKFGFCGLRENIKGRLYTYAYGKLIAANIDPIEKKPLYQFLPGSKSFSIATIGCNFRCGFCQNWEISQANILDGSIAGQDYAPADIVGAALKAGCKSISYTYTEPTIFFEYAYETAKLAKENGLGNVFVTNGFMTKEALAMIGPYLDAANVDLKFLKEDSYKKICAGSLDPVLNSIKLMKELGVWVEITTLVVPGENDSDKELSAIAEFISSVDKNIPWHISRFHPDYKFGNKDATPEETLKKAQEIGVRSGLNFVYVGNVYGWDDTTYCHACKKPLIEREVFSILGYNIKKGKCAFCNTQVPGVFKE